MVIVGISTVYVVNLFEIPTIKWRSRLSPATEREPEINEWTVSYVLQLVLALPFPPVE